VWTGGASPRDVRDTGPVAKALLLLLLLMLLMMRVYIAQAIICSRRAADVLVGDRLTSSTVSTRSDTARIFSFRLQ